MNCSVSSNCKFPISERGEKNLGRKMKPEKVEKPKEKEKGKNYLSHHSTANDILSDGADEQHRVSATKTASWQFVTYSR